MRILYVMHVDWRWIRQRPHELAIGLSESGYDVLVLFIPNLRRRTTVAGERTADVKVRALPALHLRRYRLVAWISKILQRRTIARTVRVFYPHVVWITSPLLIDLLPSGLNAPLVYDAMDMTVDFFDDEVRRNEVVEAETQCCRRASLVLASSNYIAEHLLRVHGRHAELVRNGLSREVTCLAAEALPQQHARLFYAGTISTWFDFSLCLDVLEAMPGASLVLAGPAEVKIPDHPRIHHLGPVPRSALAELASQANVLIMPFHVTPLIEGVDPVKLYEYLAWRKPIVAPYYKEIDHFEPFVQFYALRAEVVPLISRCVKSPASVLAERHEVHRFLEESTWTKRSEGAVRLMIEAQILQKVPAS